MMLMCDVCNQPCLDLQECPNCTCWCCPHCLPDTDKPCYACFLEEEAAFDRGG